MQPSSTFTGRLISKLSVLSTAAIQSMSIEKLPVHGHRTKHDTLRSLWLCSLSSQIRFGLNSSTASLDQQGHGRYIGIELVKNSSISRASWSFVSYLTA